MPAIVSFFLKNKVKKMLLIPLLFSLILSCLFSSSAFAADNKALAEERKSMPIESNAYDNWPLGPQLGAQSAILIDAHTGAILYEKNIHEKLYPASITKLLTTYIAITHCQPDEMVTFSQKAISSIHWWEDANMAVDAGSSLPLMDVVYGVLVGSANEAAYALAEHISGSIEEFSVLMNQTARELGCLNSNFITPNGIHHENHYTTAYDMALIAQAFFANETLSKIANTTRFEVPVTETQPKEGIILTAKSQLLPGKPYAYDSLIGTKTGYTDAARQTLVSCAAKNGLKLICVILKEEMPYQYADTVTLFDYGFHHFEAVHIGETDKHYAVDHHFFTMDFDLFGNSKPILNLDSNDYIILPHTIELNKITSEITYDSSDGQIASINYYYKDIFLGSISLILTTQTPVIFDFGQPNTQSNTRPNQPGNPVIFINILYLFAAIFIIIMLFFLYSFFKTEKTQKKRLRRRKRKTSLLQRDNHWHIDHFS